MLIIAKQNTLRIEKNNISYLKSQRKTKWELIAKVAFFDYNALGYKIMLMRCFYFYIK